ncbi:hypothetical protein [Halobellus limi]|uniref:Uncharacterized protein n=1 Tax=Halobellus limi TaxID=699433 RepID=A0A1H5ZFP2_9EURY|nr:hypothetical protein [Halobellus limi]SEG35248.1 hypothetical protein SAMN04488133_1984 [Halobellus limi]
MTEIFHVPGEVHEYELFDGFKHTFLLAETGREATAWIESDMTFDLSLNR